jgi:parallel beta-helix repeat protein
MGDPYIIENITMIGYDYQANIWIRNTNAHFVIRNCTFIGEGNGIDISSSDNGKIINNTFSKTWTGLRFQGICQNCIIFKNNFYNNGNGMTISQGNNLNVSENTFNNNRNGISMSNDVENSLIYGNVFKDYRSAILFMNMDGENNNFSANIMNGCGFLHNDYLYGEDPPWAENNIVEINNLVNGKPLYFYYNELNLGSANFSNAGQVILIKCNNSKISNLNLSNSTYGIGLYNCKNFTLTNLNCSYNKHVGIILYRSFNITLNSNTLHSNSIEILYGNGYNLTNNNLVSCGLYIYANLDDLYLNHIDTTNSVNNKPIYYLVNKTGLDTSSYINAGQLFLINCNNSLITDLNISNTTTQGIDSHHCFNNTYTNITCAFNHNGLCFEDSHNNIISGNYLTDNGGNGIILSGSNNNTISGNIISNCLQSGLGIYSSENKIIGNSISNCQYRGLHIVGEYNNITENNIFNNKDGIGFGESYNTISRNNITRNSNFGIYLRQHQTITENNISNNENHGLYMENTDGNVISGNMINNNKGSGMFMEDWNDNNVIINNELKFNEEFGIFLHDNTNWNSIYNNNFTGNLVNAGDNGTINMWDNGTVGNYWDDYSGADDNDDGIGDTPYADIGGKVGAQDNFPIWWDPPRFSIISPIDNQTLGSNAPSFVIEIEAGVPDSMWYTLGTSPAKHFFTTNSSISQAAWEAISSDTITITFFVNDSAGLIASDEVIVRMDRTSPSPTVSGFHVLIVSMTVIASLVGVAWNFKKKR